MSDTDVTLLLQSVRTSTATVLAELAAWAPADADMRTASLLPGWSRGHVLTHLARSGDAMAASIAGTLREERVELYPDGDAGRTRDIEAGAGRPAAEIIADVGESAQRLDRVLGATHDADAWERIADRGRSNADMLVSRWCEVEIHRVDAGLAEPADWPAGFVERLLPETLAGLSARSDRPLRVEIAGEAATTRSAEDLDGAETVVRGSPVDVLAWLFGRGDATGRDFPDAPLTPWRRIRPGAR